MNFTGIIKTNFSVYFTVFARTGEKAAKSLEKGPIRRDQDRGQVLRGDPRAGVQVPRALQPPLREEDQDHQR